MKKLLVFSLSLVIMLCMSVLPMSAQQVTKEAALDKAIAFLQKSESSNHNLRRVPRKTPKLSLVNNHSEFYIFNDETNGGYIVVSGDERLPDVLGYSYTGHFDAKNIPCNMKAWLEGYAEQINRLKTDGKENINTSRKANSEWSPISPMIECTWGHWTPFNNLCPEINGKHTPSGCVAIAMAQIMFYHKWPQRTSAIIPGYTTKTLGLVIPDTPVTTIDWEHMIPYYNPYDENKYESYTREQADAVATLMRLCNVAAKMDFEQESSSAYMADGVDALLNYFDYDSTIEELFYEGYQIDEWNEIIYDELSNGRPVMCANSGHAFVIDGCDKNGYFHMNFGEHDKVCQVDGYFLFSDRGVYDIVIGIEPNRPNTPNAYAVFDEGKLSFYYDKEKDSRNGKIITNVRKSFAGNTEIEECEFAPSFANVKFRNLEGFFENCKNLKTIKGMNFLNTSEVRTMKSMFNGCSSLESLDLRSFNTEKVTDMLGMFCNCSSLTYLDISNFNTGKVTNMMNMFCGCSALTRLDVSSFNTENVEDMCGMFYGLASLETLDVRNFDTGKVTSMGVMFTDCSSLKELDLSSFDTSNVDDMHWMFGSCNHLANLNVSSFRTNHVQDMEGMFSGCNELKHLDLSGFNTKNTKNMSSMFGGCYNLSTIYVSERWNMSNVEKSDYMFYACSKIIGGAGTTYDDDHFDGDYAHIDGGPENPGYYTYQATNLLGDVNGDGKVDSSDVTAIVCHILGNTPDGFIVDAADYNEDGKVDVVDVAGIINMVYK